MQGPKFQKVAWYCSTHDSPFLCGCRIQAPELNMMKFKDFKFIRPDSRQANVQHCDVAPLHPSVSLEEGKRTVGWTAESL